MMKKYKDAVVVVGEYTDRSGNQKKRYMTVGTLFEGDKGYSLKLSRTFNPAGLPDKDGSGEVWINFYDPKDAAAPAGKATPAKAEHTKAVADFLNDEVPF